MYRTDWEILLRNGEVESFSNEYFNRNKGTEYRATIQSLDGEKMVALMVITYPDACPSEPCTTYHLEPLSGVQERLVANPDLWLRELQEVPEQKYRDSLKQSTQVPTCPHCGRVWD